MVGLAQKFVDAGMIFLVDEKKNFFLLLKITIRQKCSSASASDSAQHWIVFISSS